MTKWILFAFDETKEEVNKKVKTVEKIVGKDNVNSDGLVYTIPEITIRCNKKQWKEVKFKLDLGKYYA